MPRARRNRPELLEEEEEAEEEEAPPKKKCSNECCGAEDTPKWRRHPDTGAPLCSACGLYQSRDAGEARPAEVVEATRAAAAEAALGLKCSHCGARSTSKQWHRTGVGGARLCNACAQFSKRKNGEQRPEALAANQSKRARAGAKHCTNCATPEVRGGEGRRRGGGFDLTGGRTA